MMVWMEAHFLTTILTTILTIALTMTLAMTLLGSYRPLMIQTRCNHRLNPADRDILGFDPSLPCTRLPCLHVKCAQLLVDWT